MKTVKMLTILVPVLGLMAWQVEVSEAASMGTAFTYQGRLLDANDTADGEYDFEFKLYDAPNGGVQQGSTIDINNVDVIDGYFTAELDFGSDVFDGNDRWLQIGVRQVANPFTILSPRQEVTPTPYALYAASGPGVPVPLDLSGPVAFPGTVIKGINTGTGHAVYGKHNSSGNFGYLGYSDRGVYGYSINDYGVRGHGGSYGVYGLSSDGYGVYGSSSSGSGAYGKNTTSGNYGLLGSETLGVYGKHEASGNFGYIGNIGYGVYGRHNSSGNYGILGGTSEGVYGSASEKDNCGVYGRNTAFGGTVGCLGHHLYGVYGEQSLGNSYGYLGGSYTGVFGRTIGGGTGSGVHGESDNGPGVSGISFNGNGVSGRSSNGYAGYFDGNVYVENNASAESFTDRTPYPKDLATAYQAVMSMERLPDEQYDENNKQVQLDHSKLSDFVRSKDGNRDLSATVSCHNEVLKHFIRKNDELEKAYVQIEQLQKQNELLEARLVKLEAVITKEPLE
jgi:hypothetical protein